MLYCFWKHEKKRGAILYGHFQLRNLSHYYVWHFSIAFINNVSTVDDVSGGKMKATIKYAEETRIEEILYDPFTGRLHQD